RLEFTRNVGGSTFRSWTGLSYFDNPLAPSAIARYSTWATDETMDESTVQLLPPLATAAGDAWSSQYDTDNRLERIQENPRMLRVIENADPSPDDLRYYLAQVLRYGIYFRDPTEGELDRLQAFATTVLASETGGFSEQQRR